VLTHPDLALNRYPDPLHYEFKEKLAAFRKVEKEQIFLGVGSDEAIDLLIRIFCSPREDNILITPPTYGMYKVCAKINDVGVKIAPLTPSFDVDLETTLGQIDENTRLLFLCSPGNPTCKVIPNSMVESILSQFKTGVVVVDEAYIDFSGTDSACCLLSKFPNLVVLQTMSKAFGLAGIRIGLAISSRPIIQLMNNVKAPYNLNKLTIQVASEAMADLTRFEQNRLGILSEREYLLQRLAATPIVKHIHHTDSNFILFVVPKAKEIYKTMADRGIVCRYRFVHFCFPYNPLTLTLLIEGRNCTARTVSG
jgi:histidinol-phosphate aminotransferase